MSLDWEALTAAYVRTPAGVARFKLPIGSPIVAKIRHLLDLDNHNISDDGDGPKLTISKESHHRVATPAKDLKPGDIVTSKTRGPMIVYKAEETSDPNGAAATKLSLMDHTGTSRTRVFAGDKPIGRLESKQPTAKKPEPAKVEKAANDKVRLPELSDDEYETHRGRVERSLNDALSKGQSTDRAHTLNGDRRTWTPERAAVHKEIVDDLWKKLGENVPREGRAIMSGGVGGSGKGTVLRNHAGIDPQQYLTIDPDEIKVELAKRGLVPEVEGVSPLEAAALVQKESTHIAGMLARRAYANKTNVIYDMTMANDTVVGKRVAQMRKAGYKKIDGVFVHIPASKSVERALSRHRKGLEEHRNGEGHGGRYVPPNVIRRAEVSDTETYNNQVFERNKGKFDEWVKYDNSTDGQDPKKIGGTGRWA